MRFFEFKENALSDKDKEWFTKVNARYDVEATNDVLVMGDEHTSCEHVIFTGTHTPYDLVRDCGDHWIHAGYEGYDRIDKGTYKFTKDYGDR